MGPGVLGLETTPINKFLYYIPILHSKAEKEGELQKKQRISGDISCSAGDGWEGA